MNKSESNRGRISSVPGRLLARAQGLNEINRQPSNSLKINRQRSRMHGILAPEAGISKQEKPVPLFSKHVSRHNKT